ncbi:hypothetical protein GYB61_09360 [bacterium]|nr:hypothetical protein [bacterium]
MITLIVFGIGVTSAALLLVLSLGGLVISGFRFWPPPSKESWQYRTFWALFRVFVLAISVLCIADFHSRGTPSVLQSVLGWVTLIVGFGSASLITVQLGWGNAHGEANSLKTGGWFSRSRNPIYVASIVGMLGLGLVVNSLFVTTLLAFWAAM